MPVRVLIVEDESLVAEIIRRLLEQMGCEVHHAPDAEQALSLLVRQAVDVVILDNVLPGQSGLQALGAVRKRTAAPVVLMTGHMDADFARDARLLGASGVLGKPFDGPSLSAVLRQVLPGRA